MAHDPTAHGTETGQIVQGIFWSGQGGVTGDLQRWCMDLGSNTAWPVQMETPREPFISGSWDSSPLTPPAHSWCGSCSEHPQLLGWVALLGQGLSPTLCTSLSPLQCLEKLAARVEEVLEALGDRMLSALGLVLAGFYGGERTENAARGDEELMPTHWEGSGEVSTV